MKNITYILFLAFGINSVSADCGMRDMQFFPNQKEISLNSMFIIQGYSYSQKTINSFKNRIVYLESESGEKIVLNLQEILIGGMNLTQAIFKPSEELKPNTKYFLKYSNQTEQEGKDMIKYNPETKKRRKVYWITSNLKSLSSLNPNLEIKYETIEVVSYGCGPSANAVFKVKKNQNLKFGIKQKLLKLEQIIKQFFI